MAGMRAQMFGPRKKVVLRISIVTASTPADTNKDTTGGPGRRTNQVACVLCGV
jgi:hypothetical protein